MKKTLSPWLITSSLLFLTSTVLAYTHFQEGRFWWLCVGCTMGLSLFVILSSFQKGEVVSSNLPFEAAQASLQAQLKATQVNLEKEMAERKGDTEVFRKKLQEAQEKCESYKKLVDVHQFEIEKLYQEAQAMSSDLLIKTRRIVELELYLEEPKALPNADKELEFLYQQLKKQVEEKSNLLDQLRAEVIQTENKCLALQKEVDEKTHEVNTTEISLMRQLSEIEEEKQKLESELTNLQQLVSQLSTPKKRAPSKKTRSAID